MFLFIISFCSLAYYSQVGPGVRPPVLRLWQPGHRHLGLAHHVRLHPPGSLLCHAALGVSVPHLPFEAGAVSQHRPASVSSADLCPGTVPSARGCTVPAATGLQIHCDTRTGQCDYVCLFQFFSSLFLSVCVCACVCLCVLCVAMIKNKSKHGDGSISN